MKEPFTNCDKCGNTINYDESYVSIVRNVEQTDFFPHERNLVTSVSNSEQILTLCGACGGAFNTKTISKIIKAHTTDNSTNNQTTKNHKK